MAHYDAYLNEKQDDELGLSDTLTSSRCSETQRKSIVTADVLSTATRATTTARANIQDRLHWDMLRARLQGNYKASTQSLKYPVQILRAKHLHLGRNALTNIPTDPHTRPIKICTCTNRKHRNNEGAVVVGGAAAVGAGVGAAVAPALAPGIVGLVGFSGNGVVGGSVAAMIQSGIGNVVARSPFSVAQSIGAGGALPAVGFVIGAAVGVVVVGGISYGVYRVVKSSQNGDKTEGYVALCEKCGGLKA